MTHSMSPSPASARKTAIRLGLLPARGCPDGEVEGCSCILLRLCPNLAVVTVNDALYRGQSYALAIELAGRVQPLERHEQPVCILRIETGAIVTHEAGFFAAFRVVRRAHLDARLLPLPRELPA